jgi:hypothetical protein
MDKGRTGLCLPLSYWPFRIAVNGGGSLPDKKCWKRKPCRLPGRTGPIVQRKALILQVVGGPGQQPENST